MCGSGTLEPCSAPAREGCLEQPPPPPLTETSKFQELKRPWDHMAHFFWNLCRIQPSGKSDLCSLPSLTGRARVDGHPGPQLPAGPRWPLRGCSSYTWLGLPELRKVGGGAATTHGEPRERSGAFPGLCEPGLSSWLGLGPASLPHPRPASAFTPPCLRTQSPGAGPVRGQ